MIGFVIYVGVIFKLYYVGLIYVKFNGWLPCYDMKIEIAVIVKRKAVISFARDYGFRMIVSK